MTPKTPPRSVYLSARTQPARRRIKFGRTSDLTATRGSYNARHIVFHAGNFAIEGSDLGVAGSPRSAARLISTYMISCNVFVRVWARIVVSFCTRTFRYFVEVCWLSITGPSISPRSDETSYPLFFFPFCPLFITSSRLLIMTTCSVFCFK